MKRFAIGSALIALSALCGSRAFSDDNPTTAPSFQAVAVTSTENRTADLSPQNASNDQSGDLQIGLNVTGPDADNVTAYGKVKIDKATDDLGENLLPETPAFMMGNPNDLTKIDDFQRKMWKNQGKSGFEVNIDLKGTKRSATKVEEVSGHFVVRAGGTPQSVKVSNLPSLDGKIVDDPALKAAGIVAKITSAAAGSRSIQIEFTGDSSNISKVQVVDASGQDTVNGNSTSTFNGTEHAEYDLNASLDATMKLQIDLLSGQKEITVPFDVKDVRLP